MILRVFDAIEARVARVRRQGDNFFVHYPAPGDTAPFPAEPAFSLVGFWNANVDRMAQMRPFATPALFVEFLPLPWTPTGRNAKHTDLTVRLHLVTGSLARQDSDYRREWSSRFLLGRALQQCLVGFGLKADGRGLSFSAFQHCETDVDHNFERVADDIYSFRTHAIDASALFENGSVMTPLPVTLDSGEVFSPEFGPEMV